MFDSLSSRLTVLILFAAVQYGCASYETEHRAHWDPAAINYAWNEEHTEVDYKNRGDFNENKNVITGIKVPHGKDIDFIYVTVPRWFRGVPSTLNKVFLPRDGSLANNPTLHPYPSWEANAIGGDCSGIQYTQSMEIDNEGIMWVLDVGSLYIADPPRNNTCPPKLLFIDTVHNSFVGEPYIFPNSIADHKTSFLNDLVIDNENKVAYISDTSGDGGIIAFDYKSHVSIRFEHSTMKPDLSGDIDWTFRKTTFPTGSEGFQMTPQDGIALSPDGSRLFYTPLAGLEINSLSADTFRRFLINDGTSKEVLSSTVKKHGKRSSPADGMTMTCDNKLLYGGLTTASVYIWDPYKSGEPLDTDEVVYHDDNEMFWPDTFAWDDNNGLWYTPNELYLIFTSPKAGPVNIFRSTGFQGGYQLGECARESSPSPWTVIFVVVGVVLLLSGIALWYWHSFMKGKNGESRDARRYVKTSGTDYIPPPSTDSDSKLSAAVI